MVERRVMTYRIRKALISFASVLLLVMVAAVFTAPAFVYAEDKTKQEEPIREVHNVGIGNTMYCFFVTHNVVLTPDEIQDKTDEEITSYILDKTGLYMKEANCKLENHKAIARADWEKKNGAIFFTEQDLESIRTAEPVDGEPVKMHLDLMIAKENGETEPSEEEGEAEKEPPYSTYKRISPELVFIAVATETDAAKGEEICEEEEKPDTPAAKKTKTKKTKTKTPKIKPEPSEEDMLPEYRTINMADRSGAPIEETLKDGDPVLLEWIEPNKGGSEGEASFFDRIPGGIAGVAVVSAAAAGAVIFAIARRKREDE